MIQPIYTSVSNANIVSCNKRGEIIHSEPIPLLKKNFLGEYRTELERAKVRKNLGILDSQSIIWGNLEGTIENQKDLIEYIERKYAYSTDLDKDITNVKEALDYALKFITNFKSESEAINQLTQQLKVVIDNVGKLETKVTENEQSITTINEEISSINKQIEAINLAIQNIDVDKNIQAWVEKHLQSSKLISLKDSVLDVIISETENNAVKIDSGLYVEDVNPKITELKNTQDSIIKEVQSNTEAIKTSINYTTKLSDETTSNILEGTTVGELKGKTFNEIIDNILFPATVRDLVQPQAYYSIPNQLVEVNSTLLNNTLTFVQNDAGTEINREESITYNSNLISEETYSKLGEYNYSGTINYNAGEYLVNNRGEVTDKRIEAGSITAKATIISTYPWYAGNQTGVTKQQLVPFNQDSGVIQFSLTGKAVIKLPGKNTQLNTFMVDGGLGFLNVDLTGWTTSTEQLNGITYKVWTKKDSYSAVLPHKIKFTLKDGI